MWTEGHLRSGHLKKVVVVNVSPVLDPLRPLYNLLPTLSDLVSSNRLLQNYPTRAVLVTPRVLVNCVKKINTVR